MNPVLPFIPRPSSLAGLGLDIAAALFALTGAFLCQAVWPAHKVYEDPDPAQLAAAFTVLGVFLLAAAVCEVGACVVRAVERARPGE